MSELILLTNPRRCPSCGRKFVDWCARKCVYCQTRIFKPEDNFAQVNREALKSFWVYFAKHSGVFHGFVYNSHLKAPSPQSPEWVDFKELVSSVNAVEKKKKPLKRGIDYQGDHVRATGGFKLGPMAVANEPE